MEQTETRQPLKVGDVSRRLGLARQTTYRLIQRGEIPSLRVGRSIRVDPAELERLIRKETT